MQEKVIVEHLYKVFGDHPDEALRLLRDGVEKEAIFERSGQTVGVCDAGFFDLRGRDLCRHGPLGLRQVNLG